MMANMTEMLSYNNVLSRRFDCPVLPVIGGRRK